MKAQQVVPQQDAATCAVALSEDVHMAPLMETQTKAEGDANRHPKGRRGSTMVPDGNDPRLDSKKKSQ